MSRKNTKRLNIAIAIICLVGFSFGLMRLFIFPDFRDPNFYAYTFIIILISGVISVATIVFNLVEEIANSSIKSEEVNFNDAFYLLEDRKKRLLYVANVNLLIGLTFAVLGLCLPILYSYSRVQRNEVLFEKINIDYALNSGYILIVMALSFFFLRIYKSIKEDISGIINKQTIILLQNKAFLLKNEISEKDKFEVNKLIIGSLLNIEKYSIINDTSNNVKKLEHEIIENNNWLRLISESLKK